MALSIFTVTIYVRIVLKIDLKIIFRKKNYKSTLYDIFTYVVLTFYFIHTSYCCWLLIIANDDIPMVQFWLNTAFTIQFGIAFIKCIFVYVILLIFITAAYKKLFFFIE